MHQEKSCGKENQHCTKSESIRVSLDVGDRTKCVACNERISVYSSRSCYNGQGYSLQLTKYILLPIWPRNRRPALHTTWSCPAHAQGRISASMILWSWQALSHPMGMGAATAGTWKERSKEPWPQNRSTKLIGSSSSITHSFIFSAEIVRIHELVSESLVKLGDFSRIWLESWLSAQTT